MAAPIVLVALGSALGGALVYREYLKTAEGRAANRAYLQQVDRLTQNQHYAVQLMIDPSRGLQLRNATQVAQLLKTTFEQAGWRLTSPPTAATSQDEARVITGAPSEWRFTGIWTRPEPQQATAPSYVAMAAVYPLPG